MAQVWQRLADEYADSARPDLAANLEPTDREYLAACRKAEADARRGKRRLLAGIYVLLIGVIVGLVGWIEQSYIAAQWRWWRTDRPFLAAKMVLTPAAEHPRAAKIKNTKYKNAQPHRRPR